MDLSTLMPQQRQIVTTLDRPLFVSAGAGSGKTFTLTRRILWALSPESGPFLTGLDQVLAITFTTDAAAEIRERVRAALIAEGMAREALAVDDAWISTIHGMCSRILRAHALELGIDPEFNVLTDTAPLLDRAVDEVLAGCSEASVTSVSEGASSPSLGMDALLDWYPLASEGGFARTTNVRDLVRRLAELASASRNGFDDLRPLAGRTDLSGLRDAYQELAENGGGKGVELAERALAAIDRFESGSRTRADLLGCLMACDAPRASKGFPKESVAWLKAEVADAFINAYAGLGSRAMEQLLQLARAVFDRFNELKAERSVLDNNDLLRLTFRAFRDHASIRRAYEGRFKLVMIDEFQDTDQQQVDLVSYLTGEGGRALCTVGDAQQSIYRFRGAEVEVFRRQERSMAGAAKKTESGFGQPAACEAAVQGELVQLVKNFRSHAEILEFVARVFDGGQGGLMSGFLDLQPHEERRDGLVAPNASRRQAVLVAGGSREERTALKAAAIARRFRALADAGQPAGGMVLLLGGMTSASVYADAIRAEGFACIISGGTVFAGTVEAQSVRALAATLANPQDAEGGMVPLLQSPLFALGAQEFLALCTAMDAETGETRRRNVDAGIASDDDAPGLDGLPLVARARAVLRPALARVGRDPLSAIARDVVSQSGWLVRLVARGAEGKAAAANVLKALDALAEAEAQVGRAPRTIVAAYDRFLAGKEAPGALNEEAGDAVRIMTVHASKGLEFPVVAVADCFVARASSDRVQTHRGDDGAVLIAALPARLSGARLSDGSWIPASEVEKRFSRLYAGSAPWLTADLVDDVCATGSVAEAWLSIRDEEERHDLEERARLLYVAMTRAREACILALDAKVSSGKVPELKLDPERDLTGAVLNRILPADGQRLDVDRLVFENAQPGDFELIAVEDFSYHGDSYEQNEGCRSYAPEDDDTEASEPDASESDSFTLVYPEAPDWRVVPTPPRPRASYSYSSVARSLSATEEDRVPAPAAPGDADAADDAAADEVALPSAAAPSGSAGPDALARDADDDPTALGSAFHAAAQWLVEMGAETVPHERREALARAWHLSEVQRARLDAALDRWERSAVRAQALAWPLVRAEVPFYTLASDDLARFGSYAEGAIDLLCTDSADATRALVIDYKTGGNAAETPDALQAKHLLQAQVYADVLHKAGVSRVELQFVRVEMPGAEDGEPQVVSYVL